jgi:6-phosphogluconolactonase
LTPGSAAGPPVRTWIGSYSPAGGTGSITGAVVDPHTGALGRDGDATPAHNASYLARSASGIVYAALENDPGNVGAFAPGDDGGLRPRGTPRPSGGALPCHVCVHPSQAYLLTTNYGSGSVAVHPIDDDGTLGAATDVVQHHGSGSDGGPGGRQAGPHAHMALCRPDGTDGGCVLVTDLGTDRIHRYRLDTDVGRLQPVDEIPMPAGSGPRHLAVHGRFAYVAGELDSTLTVVDLDADPTPRVVTTTSTVDGDEASAPSAIRLSPDGRWCYVANRGPNTIAVFSVSGARVRLVGGVPTGGEQPRDLTLSPDGRMAYVANQASDEVRSFRLDPRTGLPSPVGESLRTSQPSCVLLDES